MKYGKQIFKYAVYVIAVVAIFLLFRRCGCNGETKIIYRDTISVRVDTIYKQVAGDSDYILYPYETIKWKHDTTRITDSLIMFEKENIDTAKILSRFFDVHHYLDTLHLKNAKGYILVYDTVTQNQIIKRGIHENYSVPVVTKTITLQQPKRTVLYMGAEGLGNKEFPIYAIGLNAGLKFKNDKYWGVSYYLTRDGNPQYGVRFMLPIKFKK